MGITNSNKQLSTTSINCGESFNVILSLSATPDIVNNPTDIVLILDRSNSMSGTPLTNLKKGAKTFIDLIAESTGGTIDGQIGYGSRIGIVSFATTATQDTGLITSVDNLKTAIDNLNAGGNTNHADGFTKALDLFDETSTNAKVMIMFTDGVTTAGGNPNVVATLAKNKGVIIYSIGLLGNGGIDVEALNDWASDPDSAYVTIAPDSNELENLFKDLAKNISKTGATNIKIIDKIADCFNITSLNMPTVGSARIIDTTTIEWTINELGVTQNEGAKLEFTVKHVKTCSGEIEVNEDITYSDNEGNLVTFPNPTLNVKCDTVIYPDECPITRDLEMNGCSDTIEFDAGEIALDSQGKIVQVDVTINNVCPNKRVALAVFLYEIDEEENEYKRGFKTMTIPAHTNETCQNVSIKCIKFILPEDLNETRQNQVRCTNRNLRAKFFAHYIDYDYECCNSVE